MPKAIWILVIGMAINITGASFLWPLNTIYMNQILGQPLSVAGIVLMFNGGAGILGNLIGGKLFDKIGGYKTIMTGVSITMTSAFTLAILHQSFTAYVILLMGLGFGAGLMIPCMYAMAGSLWPEGGRRPFNAIYVAQNVGVAIGAAIGGFLASFRFDFVFFGNGLMYLVFFILAFVSIRKLKLNRDGGSTTSVFEQSQLIENKKRFNALVILCLGFLICWIAYVQWQTNISVHTQNLGIPLNHYSILWTVNGAMIVFCQPVIRFFVKRWFHSLKAQIYVGVSIFMIAYIILSQAELFTAFLAAMIVLTIGEMFVWPAIPTIAHKLAPKGKAGYYQGIVNSVGTGGRLLGPLFGGIIADLYGMTILFYLLVGMFLIPILTTFLFDRKLLDQSFSRRDDTESA
ncbi:MDR family MFS transporter [Evansella tamaricis]|uniref:MFS transporter n=1 Tax=Evansella tamaricis TaxID=2069301 RepID=A0ABS6JJA4_9BACI|nr:MFS transporter [Evansella tamaricis]MBU9713762.1 MFS transporter [Evansella tamaricis]